MNLDKLELHFPEFPLRCAFGFAWLLGGTEPAVMLLCALSIAHGPKHCDKLGLLLFILRKHQGSTGASNSSSSVVRLFHILWVLD